MITPRVPNSIHTRADDDIWGAKIRRKNVKRDILHKNIASEYDILQEIAFQNAIFYIITPQF